MTRPLDYRPTELVAQVLGLVYNLDPETDDPYRWTELIADASADGKHATRTIDNVIRELASFGALHKTGKYGRGLTDTRKIYPTPLGRAWLDRELLPLHAERQRDLDE